MATSGTEYWLNVVTDKGPQVAIDKMMISWKISSAVSALLAGFTFFVLSQPPPPQRTSYLGDGWLVDLASAALVVTFVGAMSSTVFSLLLSFSANKLSSDSVGVLRSFIRSAGIFFEVPHLVNFIALVSLGVAMWGITGAYYPVYIFGLMMVLSSANGMLTGWLMIRMWNVVDEAEKQEVHHAE
jgi:hypothetical protein